MYLQFSLRFGQGQTVPNIADDTRRAEPLGLHHLSAAFS